MGDAKTGPLKRHYPFCPPTTHFQLPPLVFTRRHPFFNNNNPFSLTTAHFTIWFSPTSATTARFGQLPQFLPTSTHFLTTTTRFTHNGVRLFHKPPPIFQQGLLVFAQWPSPVFTADSYFIHLIFNIYNFTVFDDDLRCQRARIPCQRALFRSLTSFIWWDRIGPIDSRLGRVHREEEHWQLECYLLT